ncbi:MAG: VCBS repeat-containing protein [bacterium]
MNSIIPIVLFLTVCVAGADSSDSDVDWPMYRHDKRLTARSDGPSDLTAPMIEWQYDLRGYRWWIGVKPGEETRRLRLSGDQPGKEFDTDCRTAWGLGRPRVDLAGDGVLQRAPAYAAKIIEDVSGLQNYAIKMIDSERGYCELKAYDRGERTAWTSEEFRVFQGPHPVIADANADGQLDVVVCPHYQVAVLDGRSGETIQQLRWHEGRNYGHFIVKNIDDDPALEMCVLADFYTHMEVIDNDGTELRLLWRKEIELKIESKSKILRPRWDCMQDLDTDGRFEVVVNLYNDTGDRRWHLMVYDALSGVTKLDLPGVFMEGLEDIDGDGKVELFCTETDALFVPASARLQMLNYETGKAAIRWTHPSGAWVTAEKTYPLFINSTVARGNKNVVITDLGQGERAFYISIPADENTEQPVLQTFRMKNTGGIESLWNCKGAANSRALNVEATRENKTGEIETLLSFQTSRTEGVVDLQGVNGEIIGQERTRPEFGNWGSLIAAQFEKNKPATVISACGNREVVALSLANDSPHEIWRQWGAGPLIASDFNGDNVREIAMLGWQPSGEGNITVCNIDGTVLWKTPVQGFPGPLEPWNFGTLTYLAAGEFTGTDHDDLLVFARRSTMHSDEGFLLDGAKGNLVWHRDHAFDGTVTWGFGGTPVAVFDHDGDGVEDIYSLYPVNYTVVKGQDGTQIIGRSAAGDDIFPGIWAAYCTPVSFDFNHDNTPELLWCSNYVLGVTNLEGSTLWGISSKQQSDDGEYTLANAYPVDWRGSGEYSIAALGGEMLHSYEPEKGQLQWRFPLSGKAKSGVVGDLNGDGRDEIVVVHGENLSCVGIQDDGPKLLWNLSFPEAVQEAICADIDSDGKLEIVVLTSHGFLYGLNQ